ncbi:MAG: ABC transporter permease [Acidiferrobacterales bacterium]|nr:ABC transporter permease [Acidiferrobacterales bacterium]
MSIEMNKHNNLNGLWTVLKKEIIDNLRDRRTLTTMAISITITPLLMIGFLWFVEKSIKEETDPVIAKALKLPVAGSEYAPNLMTWLEQHNIEILNAPKNHEESIRLGEHRIILVIEENFVTRFNSGKTAPVKLIHDSSITGLEKIGKNTVQKALSTYNRNIASLRLQARGIDPQIAKPIQLNISDIAKPEAKDGGILNMLPYIIITFIMAGGIYLAIDTTAGEREKGSLESLLTLPVDREILLIAKLLATCVFSALTFGFVLLGMAIAVSYAPVEAINFVINAPRLFYIFITCLPFVFAGSALLILVASYTKSYKEAQSYMGFIMMLPSMPLMLLMFLSPEPSTSNMWIPSLSQALIILETLKGETIAPSLIALSAMCTLLVATVFAVISMKLYERERILG